MLWESIFQDISIIKSILAVLPIEWDGKRSILELKYADYNWRQMEWIGWYFEYKAKELLKDKFTEGDRFSSIIFNLKRTINWDLKSSAVKTDSHKVILNDKSGMEMSIEKNGAHGEIIALCDVDYNDNARTFQKWHAELKGEKSKYEKEREQRTSISRYRKTRAKLLEILLLVIKQGDLDSLLIMKQGRNSNGKPRAEKYMVDLEFITCYYESIFFTET
ncbi:MAG: hypothetical protein LBC92_02120 [Rickettsiales bacterium]|jgi:hypothetical protein|nr:hypothetical protein [Rickettsiales bacterium]